MGNPLAVVMGSVAEMHNNTTKRRVLLLVLIVFMLTVILRIVAGSVTCLLRVDTLLQRASCLIGYHKLL